MKYTTSLLLALYCLFYTSCNKNKNTDTAYFSCYIDGQYWEPEKRASLGEYSLTAMLQSNSRSLMISAYKNLEEVFIDIFDSSKISIKTYPLNNYWDIGSRATYSTTLTGIGFKTAPDLPASVTIEEMDETTIKGTFYFKGYDSLKNKTVNITNGKFKLKYTLH